MSPSYRAPVDEMLFTIEHVARWREGVQAAPDLAPADLRMLLDEAGRFVARRIAPLNRGGDTCPPVLRDGVVTMPPGWRPAFREWAQAGWNGIALPTRYGGAGMPAVLGAANMEMLAAACMALGTLHVLAQGAVDALAAHGAEALNALYLPRIVRGEWAATMAITEPQAGSDLAALRSRAVPAGDGTYRLNGRKIFTTFGEHDLADNIVHLVLARLPDAPAGSRGISLFLVPKRVPDGDGHCITANDVACIGVEHKLGIRASPTCTMAFGERGGARAWLVGAPHQGLRCMFTMMNRARLATALQGVAIAERACQQAVAYARERRQGVRRGTAAPVAIIEHPDVVRNLLLMRALTAASRSLAYRAAAEIDRAAHGLDGATRARAQRRADLLTPLVKSYATECGVTVASLSIQVHGGAGYVEETGAAQHWRDARIAPIYEGTNGIQAIDLVGRKVVRDAGAGVGDLLDEAAVIADGAGDGGRRLRAAVRACRLATQWMVAPERSDDERLAVATPYAEMLSTTLAGALLAQGAAAAPADAERAAIAAFYAATVLPHAPALADEVTEGGRAVRAMRTAWSGAAM